MAYRSSYSTGNYWVFFTVSAGLDIIHLLTQTGLTLRIELTTWFNDTAYAQYSYFKVGDESSKWRLSISGNSGNVNYDAMARSNGELFSTYDNDNDSWGDNCAQNRHGAWWYNWCGRCNLNGEYTKDNGDDKASMSWFRFYSGRYFVPIMKSRIMVKHQGV
ncbi:angiopoietin-related protein 7-like [Argopecten irradians]|uniref:angiopoietin-related protein 7-like n=1 Tax=Argopecten irradians TaxID=31199 RepID=UPI003714C512